MNTKLDFINGNTKKCLLAMTLPMIVAMFLNMAYNLVDSLWIGNLLGETAYAALTNSTPIILLLTSVAMGATNGVSILLSQAIGAKNEQKKRTLISTSFCIAVVFSLLVTLLLELLLPTILKLLNTPMETMSMAKDYLSIYILGYLPVYLYLYFTAVLRSFGNTMFQVIAMLISTILDPIFIQKIGFQGAAIATLLSQSLCLVFMLIYIRKKRIFKFSFVDFDKSTIIPLIKNAIPSVIQQSIPAISTTFLTSLISTYSISAIAAYGITGKLETILFYPAMAFNMVLTSIIGQCIGAKRADRAKDYLKLSLKYGGVVLLILSALVIAFSTQLSNLFVSSNVVAQIVKGYFMIISIGYILNTITNCYLGSLNGMGSPTKSMLLMIFYYLVVRIPLSYAISYAGFGLNGIWVAVLISHVVACITAILTGTYSLKKNIKMEG